MPDDRARTETDLDDADHALTALRRMIDAGRLPTDGRLPAERELAAELDVGRRAVRRAIEMLEVDGLVWRRQGKGTFLGQPPDPAGLMAAEAALPVDPMIIMQARLVIEPGLAALCAERATEDDIGRLRTLAGYTVRADNADHTELWDGALHRLIARIAGNPVLLTAFAFIDEVRRTPNWQEMRERIRSAETMALYHAQHCRIVDAIEAADAHAANAAMHEHLNALSDRLQGAA